MSYIKVDPNQLDLNLKWNHRVKSYLKSSQQLYESISEQPNHEHFEGDDYSACYMTADAIKEQIKLSGLSIDNVVDGINAYFGRTQERWKKKSPTCFKPLSVEMFRNYLTKPTKYKLPAYYLLAINNVTNSLRILDKYAGAEGGSVVDNEESRMLAFAKLQKNNREGKLLEKELLRIGQR